MKFTRLYSTADRPVAEQVEWKTVPAKITGGDGAVIFEMPAVEVPAQWSQDAVNILAHKYLRKAGVPNAVIGSCPSGWVNEPRWLWPSVPDSNPGRNEFGPETSARQCFHRMAGCWTYWAWRMGLTSDEEQARIFYDELFLMLARQVGAPNSPQWFNTGLHWAYGIAGPASGQWAVDWSREGGFTYNSNDTDCSSLSPIPVVYETPNSYERPQPHACFLTPVIDDLVNEGGIMDLWVREARIFKHGSGSGVNVSSLRAAGEKLSGGGTASGVMSWLRIGDSAAGAIQSGGTTRRAAVMRIVDVDHPEVEEFIEWKTREEAKAAAMYVGSRVMKEVAILSEIVPHAVLDRVANGFELEVFGVDWEGTAIKSVDGQNSNNSVRVTDWFMAKSAEKGTPWHLTARTSGAVMKTVTADGLWEKICRAAWASADPGLLFHDTINSWNTCAADGVIRTTNPCGEFHFLDGSACNLASLNLVSFQREDGSFDSDRFEHAARLWTVVLDVSVHMASFPAKEFALGAYNYRTLGLGYANLGGLLMRSAIPYDSDEGRALAAAITALMTGVAYRTSAELAEAVGPFPRWEANASDMKRVLRNHARAAEALTSTDPLWEKVQDAWQAVLKAKSFRNAQVTLLAPTGTISFVMDCGDSTGVEPHFALVAYKNLAGGGVMKVVNQNVIPALRRLSYSPLEMDKVLDHIERTGTIRGIYRNVNEDLPVFACAGDIAPMGHVRMVAAVQPFLSGAASKTINLPSNATIADVSQVYREAHRLGVKAIALYRDGSKMNQPLSATKSNKPYIVGAMKAISEGRADQLEKAGELPKMQQPLPRGAHEYLPWRRERGYTQKARIGDQTLFWRVSEYEDGRPGEVFIELAHEGSTMRAMANCIAIAMSVSLQHGVALETIVDKFLHTKFAPDGVVEGHAWIKFASSFSDLIARDLAITYLGREDLANVVAPVEPLRAVVGTGRSREVLIGVTGNPFGMGHATSTGNPCPRCGFTLVRTGTCVHCPNCDYNTGCG